jgi:tRNA-2-methylthio-N6-dimethylallyladenosine synthase
VNTYRDGDLDFAGLLKLAARVPGVKRVRYTSPHPADFTRSVFEVMSQEPALCPHIHLPVQCGSDRILDAMKRGYTRSEFLRLVDEIRLLLPDASLTTDLIVGFPGETPGDFEETLSLMQDVRFDSAFMFKYSERPKTWAAKHQRDDVPEEEKNRRLREVIDLQESTSAEIYESRVGRTVEVLVEGPSRRDPAKLQGKTPDFKTVVFEPGGEAPVTGDLVRVQVQAATSHTLRGRLEEEAASLRR